MSELDELRAEVERRKRQKEIDALKVEMSRRKPAAAEVPRRAVDVNPIAGGARTGLQGLTFGTSDEIGSALAATVAALTHGDSEKSYTDNWADIYDQMHGGLKGKRDQFRKDNPLTSTGLEIAGGALTGGAGFGKALGSQAYRQLPNAGKIAALAGTGAVEGGLYGAGTADRGETMSGAATGAGMGAALGPIGAGVGNVLGRAGAGVMNYAGKKLGDTPAAAARRIMRDTADAEGVGADEIVGRMRSLGPEGTLTDVGDNFRSRARSSMDSPGPMKSRGRKMVDSRQHGQQDRLLKAIEWTAGKKSKHFGGTMRELVEARRTKGNELYSEAKDIGLEMTDDLKAVLENPKVERSWKRGQVNAKADGSDDLYSAVHEAKMALDDRITAAKKGMTSAGHSEAANLMRRKKELLGAIEAQNPAYIRAMNEFAGDKALEDALLVGRKEFMKRGNADEMEALIADMTEGEVELFRLGAVKNLANALETVDINAMAWKRLIGSKDMRRKLGLIMDNPEEFMKRAGVEAEFTGTRNTLVGQSSTAERQAMKEATEESIDGGVMQHIADASTTQGFISKMIKVLTRSKTSPEIMEKLSEMMLARGMPEDQIRRIFTSSRMQRALGDEYDTLVAPFVRGAAPAGFIAGSQGS